MIERRCVNERYENGRWSDCKRRAGWTIERNEDGFMSAVENTAGRLCRNCAIGEALDRNTERRRMLRYEQGGR